MKCEKCGKREAAVQLTHIENNEMSTAHLCDGCAAEKGVETGEPESTPLTAFLAQMGNAPTTSAASAASCPACGLTLADFRRTGRLGCATCYGQFEQHLRVLLRRLHGGSQHVGKVYVPPEAEDADRTARVVNLRRSLQHAVDAEDFERAASLRDQIRRMEQTS